ncbi:MAG: FxsA family protein [Pseudomonadota bacterium]
MPLLLAFLVLPLIEITLFVQVGGLIGVWPTLAIVILTTFLGSWVMRSQGQLALARASQAFNDLRDPSEPLAEGAMMLFAGVLLIVPGFFTDTIGLILLIPGVRHAIYRRLAQRVSVQGFSTHGAQHGPRAGGGDVIDGDFTEVRPGNPDNPSGWVEKDPDRH